MSRLLISVPEGRRALAGQRHCAIPGNSSAAILAARPGHHVAAAAELQAVLPSHAEIRSLHISSVGDIPLVVIQHGRVQQQMSQELTEIVDATNRRLQPAVAA